MVNVDYIYYSMYTNFILVIKLMNQEMKLNATLFYLKVRDCCSHEFFN